MKTRARPAGPPAATVRPGSFDDEAHARSPKLWISTHRDLLAGTAAALAPAVAVCRAGRTSSP